MFVSSHRFLIAGAVAASVSLSACRISANFHVVDKGRYYRSATLNRGELEHAVRTLGIRTIINLRGEYPGASWYETEKAVALENGVTLISIGMSASRLPHRADLIALLDAFRTAERPLLVHCQAGADRAGEAAAIYQMEYMGKSKKDALRMLTPKYLHFTQFLPAKRYFIRMYAGMEWAYSSYDPCEREYKYYDRTKYCGGGPAAQEPDVPDPASTGEFQ